MITPKKVVELLKEFAAHGTLDGLPAVASEVPDSGHFVITVSDFSTWLTIWVDAGELDYVDEAQVNGAYAGFDDLFDAEQFSGPLDKLTAVEQLMLVETAEKRWCRSCGKSGAIARLKRVRSMMQLNLLGQSEVITDSIPFSEKEKVKVSARTVVSSWDLSNLGNVVVSFSGGRTSAYMSKRIVDAWTGDRDRLIFVFANTGLEAEETLEFVRQCDEKFGLNLVWIEAEMRVKGVGSNLVDFQSASRNGEPFERMIEKYGIPNVSFPHCSRVLKKQAINAFLASIGLSPKRRFMAIGIRADEIDRISDTAGKDNVIYPLIDVRSGTTKFDVLRFWKEMPFDLNLPSYLGNCQACWKKSKRKLLTVAQERPEAFEKFLKWEKRFSGYRPESQPNRPLPAMFYRENTSAENFFLPLPPGFIPAVDEAHSLSFQEEFDLSNGCSDSCEAF